VRDGMRGRKPNKRNGGDRSKIRQPRPHHAFRHRPRPPRHPPAIQGKPQGLVGTVHLKPAQEGCKQQRRYAAPFAPLSAFKLHAPARTPRLRQASSGKPLLCKCPNINLRLQWPSLCLGVHSCRRCQVVSVSLSPPLSAAQSSPQVGSI
jgi:hypothetical protein